MRLKLLSKNGNTVKILVEEETHTLLNLITKESSSNPEIEFIGYHVPHPLEEKAELSIKTKGRDPLKVLSEEIENIKKKLNEFQRLFKEAASK